MLREAWRWKCQPGKNRTLTFRPPSVREVGFVEGEGEWLYAQAVALELEGVVGKLSTSAYKQGTRTGDWAEKINGPDTLPLSVFGG